MAYSRSATESRNREIARRAAVSDRRYCRPRYRCSQRRPASAAPTARHTAARRAACRPTSHTASGLCPPQTPIPPPAWAAVQPDQNTPAAAASCHSPAAPMASKPTNRSRTRQAAPASETPKTRGLSRELPDRSPHSLQWAFRNRAERHQRSTAVPSPIHRQSTRVPNTVPAASAAASPAKQFVSPANYRPAVPPPSPRPISRPAKSTHACANPARPSSPAAHDTPSISRPGSP